MVEKAVAKLRAEIEQNSDKPYVQYVGKFLLDILETNPGVAGKILAEGKTISKSIEEIRKAAEKGLEELGVVLTQNS